MAVFDQRRGIASGWALRMPRLPRTASSRQWCRSRPERTLFRPARHRECHARRNRASVNRATIQWGFSPPAAASRPPVSPVNAEAGTFRLRPPEFHPHRAEQAPCVVRRTWARRSPPSTERIALRLAAEPSPAAQKAGSMPLQRSRTGLQKCAPTFPSMTSMGTSGEVLTFASTSITAPGFQHEPVEAVRPQGEQVRRFPNAGKLRSTEQFHRHHAAETPPGQVPRIGRTATGWPPPGCVSSS